MSETKQEQAAAPREPRARKKDWEWFWRIVAGLMLLFIAWVGWVLYQITPRSVVTPLAYAAQARPIGITQSATGAASLAAPPPVAPAPRPPAAAVAEQALERAQAAARAGEHQASADIQAAALAQEQNQEPVSGNGLRLATELSAPPPGKASELPAREGKPGGAPAAKEAVGKDRR